MKKQKSIIIVSLFLVFILVSILFISPEAKKPRSQFHSYQLSKQTNIDENVERTDYIDENGKITIAADLGYATIIVSRTDNCILEKYYNEKGDPISRYNGYYALLREYDDNGNNTCVTYLNSTGEPVITVNGYAVEKFEYENGLLIAVRYYDDEMNPVLSPLYGYGELYDYDKNGNIERITFIDVKDSPMITKQGYASVEKTYYSSDGPYKGKVESEMYFDEAGNPICLSLGQYGVHREYDNYGRVSVLTYLGKTGEPIATNKGYTTIKRTYHPNGYIATEQYYDLSEKPVSLSEGQYGISQDENQIVYLDKNGKEVFNLKNFVYNHSWVAIPVNIFALVFCGVMNKRWCALFFALYICAVIYFTLLFRDNNSGDNPGFLWSYKSMFTDRGARADILKNIWLFIPLGILLYQFSNNKIVLLIPLVLSILIECIQYISGTGFCELDDIISNSLGGVIGFYAEKLTLEYIQRIKSWRMIHIS